MQKTTGKKFYENTEKFFDWNKVISYRPVFTADYIPGVPSIRKYGKKNISSDLEHIKGYTDAVTVRALSFVYECEYLTAYRRQEAKDKGWVSIPDIMSMSEQEISKWKQEVLFYLEPYLELYLKHGIKCLSLSLFFLCHGFDSSPEWYHKIPDWEECNLKGEPLGVKNKELTTACLVHPEIYRVFDKTFEVMKFLSFHQAFMGIHLENEPNLSLGRDLSDYGGNPHTISAFRNYLTEEYKNVSKLNSIAGTQYKSFEEVSITDSNWLIKVMAKRFRAKLVTGYYLTGAAKSARKHLPAATLVTRLQTGYFLKEWEAGCEINAMELTYLKDSDFNIIAWCNQWDTKIQDGMGQLNVTGGLLRGTEKILGFSEPFMQRFGAMHYSAYRPLELLHFVYRGLYYNLRMYNLHSWEREGDYVHDEPFGVSYLGRPGTLKVVADLRTELGRIKPFETFGKPVRAPLAIIVSRNARGFPGMKGWFYGNLLYKLCQIFEFPEYSCFEVIEECTSDIKDVLKKVSGVVVVDACLSSDTRQLLNEFSKEGGKLLVFGTNFATGSLFEYEALPKEYPVKTGGAFAYAAYIEATQRKECCHTEYGIISPHPVFEGIEKVKFLSAGSLELKEGAEVIAIDTEGNPAVVWKNNVLYCSGIVAPGNEPIVQFNEHHQVYTYGGNTEGEHQISHAYGGNTEGEHQISHAYGGNTEGEHQISHAYVGNTEDEHHLSHIYGGNTEGEHQISHAYGGNKEGEHQISHAYGGNTEDEHRSTQYIGNDRYEVNVRSNNICTVNQTEMLGKILTNFAKWCDVEVPSVMISRFENATVVQNWDTRNHDISGCPVDITPWTGHIELCNRSSGGIFEVRGDYPWLAYHYNEEKTVLEGVLLEQQGIKVFRKENTREFMHLENIPDTLGFISWWSGALHPVIGRFRAMDDTSVEAAIVGGDMLGDEIAWFVAEVGGNRIAEGKGRRVMFRVVPGRDNYLVVSYENHNRIEDCPLCRKHIFE